MTYNHFGLNKTFNPGFTERFSSKKKVYYANCVMIPNFNEHICLCQAHDQRPYLLSTFA